LSTWASTFRYALDTRPTSTIVLWRWLCPPYSRCEAARTLIRSAQRPDEGYRPPQSKDSEASQRDTTGAADETPRTTELRVAPLHGRSRAAPEDDRQDTRRKESGMGGRIGGRLGGVKREDGEARGGNDREG